MDELVQWLGEQLDDDELAALGAKGDTSGCWTRFDGPPEDIALYSKSGKLTVGQDRHIARHDPARVLLDIAADRKLLALFVEVGAREVDLNDAAEYAHGWVNALGMAVRLRASAFSKRPGYSEEWRPY